MDGSGGKLRGGIFVSGLGKWAENGQSCQRIHSFMHSFTDLSNTHAHTPRHTHCSPVCQVLGARYWKYNY